MPLDLLTESRSNDPWRRIVKISEPMNKSDIDQLVTILNQRNTLEQLYLNDTNSNSKTAIKIANALRTNYQTLTILDLGGNRIQDLGAISIAKALRWSKTLQKLTLSRNKITRWGLIQLFKALSYNNNLRELDLSQNDSRNYFSQIAMKEASVNYDREPMINFLRRSKSLEKLNVGYTGIFDNTAMSALKDNKQINLRFLGLARSKISKDFAKTLAEFLKENLSFESLDLTNITFFENNLMLLILDTLGLHKTLKSLNVDSNYMTPTDIKALAKLVEGNLMLESLSLCSTQTTVTNSLPLWESLIGNQTLKVLNFGDNSIGNQGATAASNLLKTNPGLEELSLPDNYIGGMGLTDLSDSLKYNTHLKTLDLSGNDFRDVDFAVLAEGLNANTALKVLDLGCTKIDSNHIKQLDQALEKSNLEELYLSHNKLLGDEGIIILAKCLEKNTHLKKLYLNNCEIGDKGAVALGKLLEKNSHLEELHLGSTEIGKDGLIALCKSINKINSNQDKKGAFKVLKLKRSLGNITADEQVISALKSGKVVLGSNQTLSRISSYEFSRIVSQKGKKLFKNVSSIEEGNKIISNSNLPEKDKKEQFYEFIKQGFKHDIFKEEKQLLGLGNVIKRFDVAQQKELIANLCSVLVRKNIITEHLSTIVTKVLEQLPKNERQFYLYHKDNVVFIERLIEEGQYQHALNLINLFVSPNYLQRLREKVFCLRRAQWPEGFISFSKEMCGFMEQMMNNKAIRSALNIGFDKAKELVNASTQIGLFKPIEEDNENKLGQSQPNKF